MLTTLEKASLALNAQRDKGIAKYGGELHETKPTALELATHAKEEAADFLQYAVELEERVHTVAIGSCSHQILNMFIVPIAGQFINHQEYGKNRAHHRVRRGLRLINP